MITEALSKIMGWKTGYLLHEGFQVKCAGTLDSDGNPQDRHLICTLDSHLPGADAHAIGNPEMTDDLWIIDSTQTSLDWSNPVCYCGQPIKP
jgi:hypothetical protein